MAFKTGDAIVHPIRGAGVVMGFEERGSQGDIIHFNGQSNDIITSPGEFKRIVFQREDVEFMGVYPVGMKPANPDKISADEKSCPLDQPTQFLRRFIDRLRIFPTLIHLVLAGFFP